MLWRPEHFADATEANKGRAMMAVETVKETMLMRRNRFVMSYKGIRLSTQSALCDRSSEFDAS